MYKRQGGALRRALENMPPSNEPILAMNGDLLTNLNLSDLIAFHKQHHPAATIVSVPLRSPYGILEVSGDSQVTGFTEKPELPFWINAGIYLLLSLIHILYSYFRSSGQIYHFGNSAYRPCQR